MGIRPTGKLVEMDGIIITRFADGQVVEGWALYEDLRAFQQLGGTLG
jgi:predicted ester cyclase